MCQNINKSGLMLSILFVAKTLPSFVLIPIVGPVADKFNKNIVMILSDLIRACVVLVFIVVEYVKIEWFLFSIVFIQFSISSFFTPARTGLISFVVNAKQIVEANTLDATTWSTMFFIGGSIGGVVTSVTGLTPAYIIDSISYIISATCIIISWKFTKLTSSLQKSDSKEITDKKQTEQKSEDSNKEDIQTISNSSDDDINDENALLKSNLKEEKQEEPLNTNFKGGLVFLKKNPQVLFMVIVKTTGALVWGAVDVTMVSIVEKYFQIKGKVGISLGIMYATEGLGTLIGPIVGQRFAKDTFKSRWLTIFIGFLIFLFGTIFIGVGVYFENFEVFLVSNFVRTFGIGLLWVWSTILIQITPPGHFVGRMFSFDYGFFYLILMLSYLWGGFCMGTLNYSFMKIFYIQTCLGIFVILFWMIYVIKIFKTKKTKRNQ
eukprot:Anaeramoba_ignava/a479085_10.p1 GENE.a479085_10~~a479085_10.p1  ORF type:complete len:434 (-),score=123.69 a479085_10:44-1345(-)